MMLVYDVPPTRTCLACDAKEFEGGGGIVKCKECEEWFCVGCREEAGGCLICREEEQVDG